MGVRQLEEALPLMEVARTRSALPSPAARSAIGYANLGEFERADAAAAQATGIGWQE